MGIKSHCGMHIASSGNGNFRCRVMIEGLDVQNYDLSQRTLDSDKTEI